MVQKNQWIYYILFLMNLPEFYYRNTYRFSKRYSLKNEFSCCQYTGIRANSVPIGYTLEQIPKRVYLADRDFLGGWHWASVVWSMAQLAPTRANNRYYFLCKIFIYPYAYSMASLDHLVSYTVSLWNAVACSVKMPSTKSTSHILAHTAHHVLSCHVYDI